MAATYLTIGSKFKPFSYDELVRPLQEATEAHQALETEYADLDTKAGVWENIANEQTDPVAHRMYKQYSDDLRAQADILATQGLTPGARQNLMRMKGRYSQEITPIENAYTRRRTLADEQRKALAENPTLMFQRDVNTMSLDDFIANPELDYGASYSGALLTQQVSNAAANLRREMQNNPRKWQSILGGQYYETLMRTGFTSDEINKAIAGTKDANPILTGIVNDVLSSSGMSGWADKSTMLKARAYANQGLWGAIGETGYDTLQNRQWDLDAAAARSGKDEEENVTEPLGTVEWGIQTGTKRQERKMEEAVQFAQGLTETEYDGQTYIMSPDLKSYAYFVEHPEEAEGYAEWRDEMWRQRVEELRNSSTEGSFIKDARDLISERKKFDKTYPEIPTKESLDRLIKRDQKDIKELEDKWGYIADDPIVSMQVGSKYEQVKSHTPIITTPFGENPTDMDKVIKRIQKSNTPLYEYDFNTQSQGKKIDTSKMAEIKKTIVSADMDRYGRIIFQTEGGKFYQYEGTNQDRAVQREIQGFIGALTNFEREDSSSVEPGGNINYPGILSHEERVYIPEDRLQEDTRIGDFEALLRNGIARPVTSGGNFLWYRATVQDRNGIPVNVVFDRNGIIIGKMSLSDLINGGGVRAFWTSEDLKTYAINRWLDTFSSK